MENKLVVYTALFGAYDQLQEPTCQTDMCDFICFTDQQDLVSTVWQIVIVKEDDLTPMMMNRRYKMLPHVYLKQYEKSIYVDSNIKIKKTPHILFGKYLNTTDIAVPKHFERNCIYDEIDECYQLGKINEEEKDGLLKKYSREKLPRSLGLGENNIILRNHNDESVIEVMSQWWCTLKEGPKRDQLSFIYILWKNNLEYQFMDESSRNKNEYFSYVLHNTERNLNFIRKTIFYIRANQDRNKVFKLITKVYILIKEAGTKR